MACPIAPSTFFAMLNISVLCEQVRRNRLISVAHAHTSPERRDKSVGELFI